MQKLKSKKFWIILIVLGIVLFLIFRNKNQKSAPQYQTAQVQKGTIVASVSTSGKVIESNVMDVNTSATGTIKKVYVEDGAKVYKGQKIAEIELDDSGNQKNASAYSSYLEAKNNLDQAINNLYTLQSAEFVANQKFINDAVARNLATNDPTYIEENATWLAAENAYNNQQNVIAQSKAAMGSSWLNYEDTSPIILAPASGTFYNSGLVEGLVLTSIKVGTIQNSSNPILSFNIGETDIQKIKVGQKATITLDNLPDKSFTGKVTALDKVGTTTSNVTTYPAIIVLDTQSNDILPNMSATAAIITDTKIDVLTVPTSSIQTQNGTTTVRVLKNGQIQNVDVTTGISSDTETQILSGLQEGDVVVTSIITARSSTNTTGNSPFGTTGRGGFGGAGGAVFRTGGGGGR